MRLFHDQHDQRGDDGEGADEDDHRQQDEHADFFELQRSEEIGVHVHPCPGRVLKQDLSTLLAASPEAFDCLVWIAKDSSHDEQVTVEQDVVGSIESGERAQSYEKPIQARARIVPRPPDAGRFALSDFQLTE